MKIFYFTATGNGLHISKTLGGELYSIPKVLKKGELEFKDEKIGIVFPCYYMGTPRTVMEFLEKVKLKSPYIFAVMSYGGNSGGGVNHFSNFCEKCGVNLDYFGEILMGTNYIPLYDMDKEISRIPKKKIEENLNRIVNEIKSGKKYVKKRNFLFSIVAFVAQKFYQRILKEADKKFSVNDSCNGCKTCEKVCPVDNIKVEKKPSYLGKCQECMACIQLCPQNSIIHKKEKSRKRFKNENVKLKEIIDANS